LYISSALTGGGAPAHPSPSLGGNWGGLYIDFMICSFVWQVMQLLGFAAKAGPYPSSKAPISKEKKFRFNVMKPP